MLKQLLLVQPVTAASLFPLLYISGLRSVVAESNSYFHAKGLMLEGNSSVFYLVSCCLQAKNKA